MSIKATTRLVSLLGNPVKQSQSPYMHNLSFKTLGLDFAYMAFEIEEGRVKEAVEAMKTLNAKGFNVTMPYKEEVMKFLDEIDNNARIIGSVNTVLNDKGKLVGYNTDGKGFIKALEEKNVEFKDKKVLILGSGGAAKGIAIQLALGFVKEIVIVNRTIKKADKIVSIIKKNIPGVKIKSLGLDEKILKKELKDSAILINTTSVGMKDSIGESIIKDVETLHKDLFVADIIYDPSKTKLLSQAQFLGCDSMNGLSMLVYQGALAFEIWTEKDMPSSVIDSILKT